MSWRKFNLLEGGIYLALKSLSSPMDKIRKGINYKYLGSDYSRYDTATFMRFEELDTKKSVTFFLHDNEVSPDSYFQAV